MIHITLGTPSNLYVEDGDITLTLTPDPEHPVTIYHTTHTHGEIVLTYRSSEGSWDLQEPGEDEEYYGVFKGEDTPPTVLRELREVVVFPDDLGKIEGPVDQYITGHGERAWYTSEARFDGFDGDKIFVDVLTEPGPIFAGGTIFYGEVAIVFNGNTYRPKWAVTNSVHRPVSIPEDQVPYRIRQMIEVEMIDRRTRRD